MRKTAFIVLLLANQSQAITNIETTRLQAPEDGLTGTLGVSLEGESGDKEKQAREGSLRFDYTRAQHNLLLIGSGSYEETNDTRTTNERFAHLRYTYNYAPRWATEGYLQYQRDEFLSRDERSLAGAGLRHLLAYQENRYSLYTGFGAYRTREKYSVLTEEDETYGRFNFYLNGSLQIEQGVTLSNTLYYQPRVNDTQDIYLFNTFTLGFEMAMNLKLNLNHVYQYDAYPVQGVSKVKSSYNAEIAWKFY